MNLRIFKPHLRTCMSQTQMMEALGMERGGPMLGEAMQKAVLWQLANPTGSKGELETYIRGEMAQRV